MCDMIDFGSPEQVRMCMDAYLETGKPIFSLGFSEPGAGSDNASMTSVTRKQADGTYVLSGQKTWVTQGEVFPYVFVVSKDEDPSPENRSMSHVAGAAGVRRAVHPRRLRSAASRSCRFARCISTTWC